MFGIFDLQELAKVKKKKPNKEKKHRKEKKGKKKHKKHSHRRKDDSSYSESEDAAMWVEKPLVPSGGSKTQLPCASAPAVVKGPKLEVVANPSLLGGGRPIS
ncbi:hypothetical protein LSAT2_000019 [Lamellibrachia satsuma]|nr:hypothetical protein LSAT2_000019 [Lamellibrachia satsuma]